MMELRETKLRFPCSPNFLVDDVCLAALPPRSHPHRPTTGHSLTSPRQAVRVAAASPAGGVTVPPAWPGYAAVPADYKPLGRAKVRAKKEVVMGGDLEGEAHGWRAH
jgi:hypothetical protein